MSRPRWRLAAVWIGTLAAAFLVGRWWAASSPGDVRAPSGHETQAVEWTCSMHPQVRLPEAGPCPLCGMDLVPAGGVEAAVATGVQLDPAAIQRAAITTTRVEERTPQHSLELSGRLAVDQARQKSVTAWSGGRIERMHVESVGQTMAAGQPLFDLYSPELVSAQEEYLQAQHLANDQPLTQATVVAAREKLRLLGFTAGQIDQLEKRGTPAERVTVRSPLAGVVIEKHGEVGQFVQRGAPVYSIAGLERLWLLLDAYETDAPWLTPAGSVEFTVDALPGRTFEGQIELIDPVVDSAARTLTVRAVVDNPSGVLRPNMLARARLHPEADAEPALVIPRSAVLWTGPRSLVYVEDPTTPGHFQGRQVTLAGETDTDAIVASGLRAGEKVVTHGAFKIDSALQILAKPSAMSGSRHPAATAQPVTPQVFTDYLAHHVEVAAALAGDAFDRAQRASMAAAQAASRGSAPGDSVLARISNELANADTIDTMRERFLEAAKQTLATLEQLEQSGATLPKALEYHCPMAGDGDGANWLQATEPIANPFYGSRMHRCGALVQVHGTD